MNFSLWSFEFIVLPNTQSSSLNHGRYAICAHKIFTNFVVTGCMRPKKESLQPLMAHTYIRAIKRKL